eukprot:11844236-Alexandrium_andersonii.AAC.1
MAPPCPIRCAARLHMYTDGGREQLPPRSGLGRGGWAVVAIAAGPQSHVFAGTAGGSLAAEQVAE